MWVKPTVSISHMFSRNQCLHALKLIVVECRTVRWEKCWSVVAKMKTKEKKQDEGVGWINEYLNLSLSNVPCTSFCTLVSLCRLHSLNLYQINTQPDTWGRHVVFHLPSLPWHFSYVAFLAKNSWAVKHLHLPSAHSLPPQAIWVSYRQRACYLWTIINIQNKQLLQYAECSVLCRSIKIMHVSFFEACFWRTCTHLRVFGHHVKQTTDSAG